LWLLPCLYLLSRQLRSGPQTTAHDGQSRGEQVVRTVIFGLQITNRIAFLVFVVCWVIGFGLPFFIES
jgi:hypothetical protein